MASATGLFNYTDVVRLDGHIIDELFKAAIEAPGPVDYAALEAAAIPASTNFSAFEVLIPYINATTGVFFGYRVLNTGVQPSNNFQLSGSSRQVRRLLGVAEAGPDGGVLLTATNDQDTGVWQFYIVNGTMVGQLLEGEEVWSVDGEQLLDDQTVVQIKFIKAPDSDIPSMEQYIAHGVAAGLRRPALRAVAPGPARHLPGLLPAVRGGLRGQRPGLAPRPPGPAARPRRPAGPAAVGTRPRACCSDPGCCSRGSASASRIGTKWTAAYPLAAFGILVWVWSAGARRSFGVRWLAAARRAVVDGLPGVRAAGAGRVLRLRRVLDRLAGPRRRVRAAPVEHAVHRVRRGATLRRHRRRPEHRQPLRRRRHLADRDRAGRVGPRRGRSSRCAALWHYHHDVYIFHTHYLNCSNHPYQSAPSGWPLLNRGVGVATDLTIQPGEQGCTAAAGTVCYRQVLLLGTPLLWWGGCLALHRGGRAVARHPRLALRRRDRRDACRPGCRGCCTTTGRSSSSTAIAFLPFLVLAITLVMGQLIGPSRLPSGDGRRG